MNQTSRRKMRTRRRYGQTPARPRAGFTLIEIMVVVSVIVILLAMVLVGYIGALEMAKSARTRGQIAKLNAIVMGEYEAFQTRRVPLVIGMSRTQDRTAAAARRVAARRELMRMELPDRKSDVLDAPVTGIAVTAKAQRFRNLAAAGWTRELEGAEALYMIVRLGDQTSGESMLDFFRESEIGDVDNDGMNEFLDGWGRPIRFFRWAPGFSDISIKQYKSPNNPDPFDPLGACSDHDGNGVPESFALYPLIYSSGPDGDPGLEPDAGGSTFEIKYVNTPTWSNNPFVSWNSSGAATRLPDCSVAMSGDVIVGRPPSGTSGHVDNIHSHLIGVQE